MQCDACLEEPATGLWRLEPEMLATSVERENIAAQVGGRAPEPVKRVWAVCDLCRARLNLGWRDTSPYKIDRAEW